MKGWVGGMEKGKKGKDLEGKQGLRVCMEWWAKILLGKVGGYSSVDLTHTAETQWAGPSSRNATYLVVVDCALGIVVGCIHLLSHLLR